MKLSLITLILFIAFGCASVYQDVRAQQGSIREGVKPSECEAKVMSTFVARLAYTYPRADMARVTTRCKAYPDECTPEALEGWVSDSHWSRAFGAMGDAMQGYSRSLSSPKPSFPIQCTSVQDLTGVVRTTCR